LLWLRPANGAAAGRFRSAGIETPQDSERDAKAQSDVLGSASLAPNFALIPRPDDRHQPSNRRQVNFAIR
jgi:hypothetical protein